MFLMTPVSYIIAPGDLEDGQLIHNVPTMSRWLNGTEVNRLWTEVEKWVLVTVLGIEMTMGVVGNCLVLLVKLKCKGQFCCHYQLPFLSLTLSDLGCSLFIMSGSLLAVLTGGQMSPWCEIVSLLKFTFISSSLGSIALLCMQRTMTITSMSNVIFAMLVGLCLVSWVSGTAFGSVPVIKAWIRYDSAEMLCAVFWESSYSDMMVFILCTFSICIFLQLLIILICLLLMAAGFKGCDCDEDMSSTTPLLVSFYLLCYTPFALSELILLGRLDLLPAPYWLRTLASVMSYLNCGLNPCIYCSNQHFREAGLALLWTYKKAFSEPILTRVTKLEL